VENSKLVWVSGRVAQKKMGVTKGGAPWVSLTVDVAGRSRVEGEDQPVQHNRCFCVGHSAKEAAKAEVGDWVCVKGEERAESFEWQGEMRTGYKIEADEVALQVGPAAPPAGEDDLPF
jgi:hypothetical protein